MNKHSRWGGALLAVATVTLSAVVLATVFLVGGCGSSDQGSTVTTASSDASGPQVTIVNHSFDPATVTIDVGETLTWVNQDGPKHDVAADNGEFASQALSTGESFSFTFTAAGTYPYHCGIHPDMTATVIVQ